MIIDLGTGDGRFVYRAARENPDRFYIGIDAQAAALEKISEKTHRKPAKGGLQNLIFIQAAVEALPAELDGVADEVHIHFPWGSLLRAVIGGEVSVLCAIHRLCAPGAWIEVVTALDFARDRAELERLGLAHLSASRLPEYLKSVLAPRYRDAGFTEIETGVLAPSDSPHIPTSWAERLRHAGNNRPLACLIARSSK